MAGDFTIGGVEVYLYHGDGDGGDAIQESVDSALDGLKASMRLQCPWSDRFTAWTGFLGYATGSTIGSIVRVPPIAYPDDSTIHCQSISGARPVKHAGGLSFTLCQFTAHFARLPYEVDGTPSDPSGALYTTTRTRVSADVIQVPTGTFTWSSGPESGQAVPDSMIGVTVPRMELSVTRHFLPYAPIDEVMTYIGTANSVAVVIGDRTFDVGELLFAGANVQEAITVTGSRNYEGEYIFMGAAHDWNELLAKDMAWRAISSGGTPPFAYADAWNNLP